jgi:hypothetical protein
MRVHGTAGRDRPARFEIDPKRSSNGRSRNRRVSETQSFVGQSFACPKPDKVRCADALRPQLRGSGKRLEFPETRRSLMPAQTVELKVKNGVR